MSNERGKNEVKVFFLKPNWSFQWYTYRALYVVSAVIYVNTCSVVSSKIIIMASKQQYLLATVSDIY